MRLCQNPSAQIRDSLSALVKRQFTVIGVCKARDYPIWHMWAGAHTHTWVIVQDDGAVSFSKEGFYPLTYLHFSILAPVD